MRATLTRKSSRTAATRASRHPVLAARTETRMPMRLVPFTGDWLPDVRDWFDHPEVTSRFGGRDWPRAELQRQIGPHPEETFLGLTVLRRHVFVAFDPLVGAVGLVTGEVYDGWFAPDAQTGAPARTEDGRTMSAAFVVRPDLWNRGHGRAILQALIGQADVADVTRFVLSIENDNAPALHCAQAAGFTYSVASEVSGMLVVEWVAGKSGRRVALPHPVS